MFMTGPTSWLVSTLGCLCEMTLCAVRSRIAYLAELVSVRRACGRHRLCFSWTQVSREVEYDLSQLNPGE
jgi:hypothetical protein